MRDSASPEVSVCRPRLGGFDEPRVRERLGGASNTELQLTINLPRKLGRLLAAELQDVRRIRAMVSRVLFGLLAILTLGGAAAAAIGMQRSSELTGDLIGYGIPNEVAAMIGIGLLSFAFGLLLLIAASVAALGDRLGLWKKLATPVLPESHPVARAGRGVLGAKRIWDTFVSVVLLGVVAFTAFQSQLVAVILGCTALLIGVLYWLLKDRAKMGGPSN